jgi:hypothetical protein
MPGSTHKFLAPNCLAPGKPQPSLSPARKSQLPRAAANAPESSGPPADYPASAYEFAVKCLAFEPDQVQKRLLCEPSQRVILNCTRQWGKSTVAAIKALHHALTEPGSVTCICCPSARQSAELLRKIQTFARQLGIPRRSDGVNEISFLFPNHSRIIGLEACHVPDTLYNAVRPMLAAVESNSVWLLSTPGARSGFFYETWNSSGPDWTKVAIPATECPRISPRYIAEERARMTAGDFAREYLCQFSDPNDALFPSLLVHQAIAPVPQLELYPWQSALHPPLIKDLDLRRNLEVFFNQFPKPPCGRRFFCGLDLGMVESRSVLCIIERSLVVAGNFNFAYYDYPRKPRWVVRYLQTYPKGAEYPEIVSSVAGVLRHPALEKDATLTVDATGVGMPVVQLFRQACRGDARVCALTITAGDTAVQKDNYFSVPRSHLLAELLVKLQNRDLLISDNLTEGPAFVEELCSMRISGSTAPDDRVFAAALALWPSRTAHPYR